MVKGHETWCRYVYICQSPLEALDVIGTQLDLFAMSYNEQVAMNDWIEQVFFFPLMIAS